MIDSRILFGSVLAVAIGCGVYLGLSREVAAHPSGGSFKTGFINLKKVFKEYDKVKEMQNKIDYEHKQEIAKIKGLEEEVKALRQEIPLYLPGSPIRKRKEKELAERIFSLKYKKERAKFFRVEKLKSGISTIYQEVNGVITEYAKKHNYSMIIKMSEPDFFGTANYEALQMEINLRDVLYYDQKNDITATILKILNKKGQ